MCRICLHTQGAGQKKCKGCRKAENAHVESAGVVVRNNGRNELYKDLTEKAEIQQTLTST